MAFRTWAGRFLGRFDIHMQEVLRGAAVALILKIFGAALTFGMTVAVGRKLGTQGAGVFFLALSVVTIASVLGKVGMDNTLLRFSAAHASHDEWGRVKGVARLGLGVAGIALMAATTIVFLATPLLAEHVFEEPSLTLTLRIMAIAILPLGLFQLLAQLLRGLRKIAHSVLVQSVWLPAMTILGIFIFVPVLGVEGAGLAYLAGTVITLLIGTVLWRKGIAGKEQAENFPRRELMASSNPLFAVAAIQLILLWASTLILGIFHPSEAVGIFSAANRTAKLLAFVLLAMNLIAAPKFSALYRAGDLEAIERIARGSAKLLAIVALPLLLVIVAFPKQIMTIFGPGFSSGWPALVIIAIGHYINVATGLVSSLLMMTGNERYMRNVMIITAAVALTLNLVLTPVYGVNGAAIALATALAVQNITATLLVRRRLGIWALPLGSSIKRSKHV